MARDPEELERRVAELERQLAAMGPGQRFRGFRRQSEATWAGLPLWSIAVGPDLSRGEWRGHARGVLALGDMATGVVAVGGLARGGIAIGGLAVGVVSLGGVALGLLLALGGLAVGGLAVGGAAGGGAAIGGGAVGYHACGGAAFGHAVVSASQRDPEALEFFEQLGLAGLCAPRRR
jgi:hypothetical protein